MPDEYVRRVFAAEDHCLREVRARADRAGLPQIQLPPATARAVQVLLRAAGAERVLEVGALAGYSAVWIARALPPDGRLITLEIDPEHAALARRSLEAAGVADRAEVQLGDAGTVMAALGPPGSFDAVFLDADKERYALYMEEAARLLRPGGLLLADNALWKGRVAKLDGRVPDADDGPSQPQDPEPLPLDEERARLMHAFNRKLADDPRFDATVLPVGDGLAVAVRR